MGWGFQLLFTISSQLIGISLAGVFRRFLIWYVNILKATMIISSLRFKAFRNGMARSAFKHFTALRPSRQVSFKSSKI